MKIPKDNKFKRDNKRSFIIWITEFDVNARALDINQNNWRDILLCCTESRAFTFVPDAITHNTLKIEMKKCFFGDDCCRTLQHKFRELIFRKGGNVNTFIDELTKAIRELFDIEDPEAINSIAINHVVSNLEEDMHQDERLFQLTGDKSLENLLEFIVIKMEGNTHKPKSEVANVTYGSVAIATGGSNDRIDRPEKMISTILKKVDDKTPSQSLNPLTKSSQQDICLFCYKSGHVGSKCFKHRKCYACEKIGNIAKFCAESQQSSSVALLENTDPNFRPAHCTMVNVEIGGENVQHLYDTESQFLIISK